MIISDNSYIKFIGKFENDQDIQVRTSREITG